MWAFPARELEAFEKLESSSGSSSRSSAAADEWSMLLQRSDAAAAAAHGATGNAAHPLSGDDSSRSNNSSSNSNKLKKPLKQLVSGVQQLLLSDAVLSDATHAVFGPKQQQREFSLETRSATAAAAET
ncbi:hypothetical protein ETH_00031090 [Eimeria tenella]|nr:hypothetical protein ETH_00031090 [Eimeria tenella]CDJ43434.1 hypothetical protein ETH_00031090 [Eimeria tenella]|eukprot:XP_013234184.1 hypothetical protein ETH_00031090 [Eimeria tenella]